METAALLKRASELVEKAESVVAGVEHVEATQLRIAVHRLEMFVEQHAHVQAQPESAAEPESEDVEPEADAEPVRKPRARKA